MCSDCEAYGLKKHRLTRSDCLSPVKLIRIRSSSFRVIVTGRQTDILADRRIDRQTDILADRRIRQTDITGT